MPAPTINTSVEDCMGDRAGVAISIIRRSSRPSLTMRKHLTGLDHAVIRVDDLDRASDDFAAMGFTLSPRGRHSIGTENRCVMFGFDYIELLWVPPGVDVPFYGE